MRVFLKQAESEMGTLIDADRSEPDELETLGRHIKKTRLQRVLSQSDLAVRSGLRRPRSLTLRLESGYHRSTNCSASRGPLTFPSKS